MFRWEHSVHHAGLRIVRNKVGRKDGCEVRCWPRLGRSNSSLILDHVLGPIGARGFEPPTSCAQGRRANQTALRPDFRTLIVSALGSVWKRVQSRGMMRPPKAGLASN